MNDKHADAIVIGAGHNGLVCAAYLAKAGLDVLIVERSHRIGGACVTEELVEGFRFSTFAYGAHGPGAKICGDLEVPPFDIEALDPSTFHPFPDGDHVMLFADADKTAAGLDRFGPREAEGYLDYGRAACASHKRGSSSRPRRTSSSTSRAVARGMRTCWKQC